MPGHEDDIGLDEDLQFRSGSSFRVRTRLRTADELAREFPRQRYNLDCPDCGSLLVLKDGKYGIFYGCIMYHDTGCKGVHNCHKHDAQPFGVPGNAKTRAARKEAHSWLDRLWKTGEISREQSYVWVSQQLGIEPERCHIGFFDQETCDKVVYLVRHRLGDLTRFEHLDRNII